MNKDVFYVVSHTIAYCTNASRGLSAIAEFLVMCAEYEVVTVTGNARGAGTDANVFITMFGKTGQTPRLALNRSNFDNPFERSQSDVFLLKTKCVGPLNKIR